MKTENKVCPRCGKTYTGYPAVSRNGLGDICPSCGRIEAFEAAGFSPEKIKELSEEIDRKEEMVRKKVEAYNAGEIDEDELFAKEEDVKEGPVSITVSMPASHYTPEQIENLRAFVAVNEEIIKTGLPAVSTEIVVENDVISFPWLEVAGNPNKQIQFISKLGQKIRDGAEPVEFENFEEIEDWVG